MATSPKLIQPDYPLGEMFRSQILPHMIRRQPNSDGPSPPPPLPMPEGIRRALTIPGLCPALGDNCLFSDGEAVLAAWVACVVPVAREHGILGGKPGYEQVEMTGTRIRAAFSSASTPEAWGYLLASKLLGRPQTAQVQSSADARIREDVRMWWRSASRSLVSNPGDWLRLQSADIPNAVTVAQDVYWQIRRMVAEENAA